MKKEKRKSIKGNNKDTFFLGSEKNIKRDTLKQGKQTFFDVAYDKHEKSYSGNASNQREYDG